MKKLNEAYENDADDTYDFSLAISAITWGVMHLDESLGDPVIAKYVDKFDTLLYELDKYSRTAFPEWEGEDIAEELSKNVVKALNKLI